MALVFWDASALVKRYAIEMGSDTVNAIFAASPSHQMASTSWGYVETFSMLLRRRNGGVINAAAFTTAITALQQEVVLDPDFGLVPVDEATVFASVSTIQQHNLNTTDAVILTALLEYRQASPPDTQACVVVASDKRLLRASHDSGLNTIDPEDAAAADVPALLANL